MVDLDDTITKLTNWLNFKLRQLKMTIEEVTDAVDKDDESNAEVLRAYNLNKRIKVLNKMKETK